MCWQWKKNLSVRDVIILEVQWSSNCNGTL